MTRNATLVNESKVGHSTVYTFISVVAHYKEFSLRNLNRAEIVRALWRVADMTHVWLRETYIIHEDIAVFSAYCVSSTNDQTLQPKPMPVRENEDLHWKGSGLPISPEINDYEVVLRDC